QSPACLSRALHDALPIYRSDMHEAEEVSRGLFVARRDAALVLDSVHETLDQVPFFVQVLVVVSRLLAVALGRNDRLCSVRFNGLDRKSTRLNSSHQIISY